jgi:hypothetical protein
MVFVALGEPGGASAPDAACSRVVADSAAQDARLSTQSRGIVE